MTLMIRSTHNATIHFVYQWLHISVKYGLRGFTLSVTTIQSTAQFETYQKDMQCTHENLVNCVASRALGTEMVDGVMSMTESSASCANVGRILQAILTLLAIVTGAC